MHSPLSATAKSYFVIIAILKASLPPHTEGGVPLKIVAGEPPLGALSDSPLFLKTTEFFKTLI